MRKAIFPGTFDPFTIGHYSVVERALTFMDEIVIGIGINENKNTYFPLEKREEMIRELYKDDPRIRVMSYDCLTIDFAQEVGSKVYCPRYPHSKRLRIRRNDCGHQPQTGRYRNHSAFHGAGTDLCQLYYCTRAIDL